MAPTVNGEPAGVRSGVGDAPAGLSETLYSHLRSIAQRQMNGERAGHTLTATALVHEAFLRLGDHPALNGTPSDSVRSHQLAFFSAAAEAMRRILIEHARARGRIKRGGNAGRAQLNLDAIGEVADLTLDEHSETVLAFDEAFERLLRHDPRFAEVVRLRFYAGLTVAETAEALQVSERTVNNDWVYARAWLARELRSHRSAP